jgi:hypothetical protein
MRVAYEELAKLHFINSLFADLMGHDLYLAKQVKAAIDAALEEETEPEFRAEKFATAAVLLLQNHFRLHPRHGFAHWDCAADGPDFDPLWARQDLISVFKKLSPYPSATVLVTNLRTCICPPGKRWTRALHREYGEAIGFIQELARSWSTSRAELTLLFF